MQRVQTTPAAERSAASESIRLGTGRVDRAPPRWRTPGSTWSEPGCASAGQPRRLHCALAGVTVSGDVTESPGTGGRRKLEQQQELAAGRATDLADDVLEVGPLATRATAAHQRQPAEPQRRPGVLVLHRTCAARRVVQSAVGNGEPESGVVTENVVASRPTNGGSPPPCHLSPTRSGLRGVSRSAGGRFGAGRGQPCSRRASDRLASPSSCRNRRARPASRGRGARPARQPYRATRASHGRGLVTAYLAHR